MDLINLRSLNVTAEESKGLIKFLVEKRGITTKKLLSTIKLNLKRKNNKDLVSKLQQKLIKSIKSQRKLAKTQLELLKSQQKLIKSIKTQQKLTKQSIYLEYMSNGNNSLSFDEYLELIKPYLNDLINVYKAKGEWKLQLSAEISFVSQKPDSNETHIMYTRSFVKKLCMEVKQKKSLKNLLCNYYKNTRIIYKIK